MKFIQALMWIFSLTVVLSLVLISVLFGSTILWYVLTLYPILTMATLTAVCFCVVMGIAYCFIDRMED